MTGSATELLAALGDRDTAPVSVKNAVVQYYYDILYPAGITFEQKRTNKTRLLIFKKRDANDGGDGNAEIYG